MLKLLLKWIVKLFQIVIDQKTDQEIIQSIQDIR